MSITSEIRLRVRKEGDVVLNQLSTKLNDLASRSTLATSKFNDLSNTLKTTDALIRTKSINGLNDYARAWRELANSVDVTSREFREASRQAERFERQARKAQGSRFGGLAGAARTAGAVAAAGVFGGPEGAIGAIAGGLMGGPAGAAVGGAIGAQIGGLRQQAAAIGENIAQINKYRIALAGVSKDQNDYSVTIADVTKLSKTYLLPITDATEQYTKLKASIVGAGYSTKETTNVFKGIAAAIIGTGGSAEDLNSALRATAQVFSKGKVSAEELRQQIGERLPGAFTIFASAIGKTPQQLDKALEDGEVSLEDFFKFTAELLKRYDKTVEILGTAPENAGARLKLALDEISLEYGGLFQKIGAGLQDSQTSIINWAVANSDSIKKLTVDIVNAAEIIIFNLDKIGSFADNAISSAARAFSKVSPGTANILFGDFTQERPARELKQYTVESLFGIRKPTKFGSGLNQNLQNLLQGSSGGGDGGSKRTRKAKQDISRELRDVLIAGQNEQNPIIKAQLEFESDILKIREQELGVNDRSVKLNAVKVQFLEKLDRLGKQIAEGNASDFLKGEERNRQIEQTITNLEIEAGIIDEKQAREIEKQQLIQQLQRDGGQLTEEQLKRIDDAQARIAEKTSETTQLLKAIGQNVLTSIGDAFESLFTKAQSLRDIFGDLLRQTARLILNLGLQAGAKALFPSLFAMGGVMSSRGPLPLKRYAGGGIATSPQLAMFGEGSRPEAYVPLPDGRTIPVTMKNGAGGGINVSVNVDAAGSEVTGNNDQAGQLGKAIGLAVQQELIKQKRPGGLLSGA